MQPLEGQMHMQGLYALAVNLICFLGVILWQCSFSVWFLSLAVYTDWPVHTCQHIIWTAEQLRDFVGPVAIYGDVNDILEESMRNMKVNALLLQ